jgi:excisionase family DNA binding protein
MPNDIPQSQDGPPILVDVDGAARLLCISGREVWRMIADGEIPSIKWGRRRLVRRAALEVWAAKKEAAEAVGK